MIEGQGLEVAEGRRPWPPGAKERGFGLSRSPGSSGLRGNRSASLPDPFPVPDVRASGPPLRLQLGRRPGRWERRLCSSGWIGACAVPCVVGPHLSARGAVVAVVCLEVARLPGRSAARSPACNLFRVFWEDNWVSSCTFRVPLWRLALGSSPASCCARWYRVKRRGRDFRLV